MSENPSAATPYEPCKLGHRFACPHLNALPRPDQRCYCGALTWAEAQAEYEEARRV